MKLRKGKHTYTVPKVIGEILHAVVDESRKGGYRFVVQQLDWEDMRACDKKLYGRPSKLTLYQHKPQEIRVWPTPDASYDLVIRFNPPAEEM